MHSYIKDKKVVVQSVEDQLQNLKTDSQWTMIIKLAPSEGFFVSTATGEKWEDIGKTLSKPSTTT